MNEVAERSYIPALRTLIDMAKANNGATCLEERSSAFSAAKVFGATRTAAEPKPTLKKFLRFI